MASRMLMLWCTVMALNLCHNLSRAAACDQRQSRCPCLRYTYKMATYKNKCFQFYYGSKTWKEAKNYCVQQGGRLAMLNDPDTFTFVRSTLNSLSWNAADLWIGAHDMVNELQWMWTNYEGESDVAMTWSFWAPDHPKGWFHNYKDCVLMKKDSGQWKWHEAMCHTFPFEYKFICEYEMSSVNSADEPGEVAGIHQYSDPEVSSSNPLSVSPEPTYTIIRHRKNNKEPLSGAHKVAADTEKDQLAQAGLNSARQSAIAESNEGNGHHVPVFVVIAFLGGMACTLAVVLFIIIRRRRKKKAGRELYPGVEYHAHSGNDGIASNTNTVADAAGGAMVCPRSGKLCKVAVDMGAEACACAEQPMVRDHNPGKRKTQPNVYVSVQERHHSNTGLNVATGCATERMMRSTSDGNLAAERVESPTDFSLCSSLNNLNEAPPTYDEACAHIFNEQHKVETTECPYVNDQTKPESTSQPCGGAVPKQTNTVYLPMNGSNRNSPTTSIRSNKTNTVSRDNEDKDKSQYLPMSLGDLPPVPTDDGYEIPVSRELKPEAARSIRDSAIYSEIPDATLQPSCPDDEQIYSTID